MTGVYFFPRIIDAKLKEALASLDNNDKLAISVSSLIKQLASEIRSYAKAGDWNVAVKFAYYCHEIAKIHKCHHWFDVFLEVRKVRDQIQIVVDGFKERDGKRH